MMPTYELLYQLYRVEGLSIRQVGSKLGISSDTIRYRLNRYGIPRRTKSEALSGEKNPMYGKVRSDKERASISSTLVVTNADPIVKVRRSKAASGSNNPMFGKTHTQEVRDSSRQRLAGLRITPEFQGAHKRAMARLEVRKSISKKASERTGEKNPFFGKVHSEGTKAKISSANLGRFQGGNGSNWQGGKTSLNLLIRNSENTTRWRKAVLERDGYTCQICGKKGGKLHVDHIRALALLLRDHTVRTLAEAQACESLWDLDNGRTLCIPCHKSTPSFAGKLQSNFGRS